MTLSLREKITAIKELQGIQTQLTAGGLSVREKITAIKRARELIALLGGTVAQTAPTPQTQATDSGKYANEKATLQQVIEGTHPDIYKPDLADTLMNILNTAEADTTADGQALEQLVQQASNAWNTLVLKWVREVLAWKEQNNA